MSPEVDTCAVHCRTRVRIGDRAVCPTCLAGKSRELVLSRGEALAQLEASNMDRRVDAARIPAGFLDCRFDNFQPSSPRAQRICEVLSAYAGSFREQRKARAGFLFIGAPGTGKTHLACAMVRAIAEGGFCPLYASLPRLTSDLRAQFGRAGGRDALLAEVCEADFLVLDEIDLHGQSDHDYNTLYDIINRRYEQPGYPTLAISNRSLERLVTDLDERIVSRILGGSNPIAFDWPSRREVRLAARGVQTQRTAS